MTPNDPPPAGECSCCGGEGAFEPADPCPVCRGWTGQANPWADIGYASDCAVCGNEGRLTERTPCPICGGTGRRGA